MTNDVLLQWLRHLLSHKIPHTVMLFLWRNTKAVEKDTMPFDSFLSQLMRAFPCQSLTTHLSIHSRYVFYLVRKGY